MISMSATFLAQDFQNTISEMPFRSLSVGDRIVVMIPKESGCGAVETWSLHQQKNQYT